MNAQLLVHRLRAGLLAGVVVTAVACSDHTDTPSAGATTAPLRVGLEVSSADAVASSRVAVALTATLAHPDRLGGLQGTLRFDPSRLRYAGQDGEAPFLAIVNDAAAATGSLRILSADVAGLAPRTAVVVFDVLAPDYTRGLTYSLEAAATTDVRPITMVSVADRATVAADLAVPAAPRFMRLADWNAHLFGDAPGGLEPQQTPGQYLPNLRFGDANLSSSLNVFDYTYVANVAVGNQEIIIGTDSPSRDAVVAGNVFPANNPGLGEPGDANPPGREGNGSRTINVFDALAIGNEVVGNLRDIVGELIPGRGPLPATHAVLVPDTTITDPVVGQLQVIRVNRTLDRDTIWELSGVVSVRDGATLTVQAGTRVEGQTAIKAALFIERSGRLVADGTPLEPIVFSCTGTKVRGCWGGIWVAGNAHVNEAGSGLPPSPAIAGRAAGGCAQRQGEGGATTFGGCNDADSSGVIRYVQIEYGGFILSGNNELNGLTMGGVGSGTVVDFVQAHAGLDDGVELFGGTVNVKHLYLTANSDDSFDFAYGWNAKAQFLLIQHDTLDGDKGFEVDNTEDTLTYNNAPRTSPTIYNVTFVGRQNPTGGAGNQSNDALHIRRGARPEMRNFLVLAARRPLDIDDGATCGSINTELRLTNSLFAGSGSVGNSDADPTCPPYAAGATLEADFIQDAGNSNTVAGSAAGLLKAPFSYMLPDFRAVSGSQAATLVGATPPSDGFFDPTATYVGAVAPATTAGGNIPWYSGWTRGWLSATQP